MPSIRMIARLDIKGSNLIKGIHLEGLRVIGDPNEYAIKYYEQGADELIYIDCVASLYGRNNLTDIVLHASKNVFIPMTVGGGVRSVIDAENLLKNGADKIAINTAAIKRPELISEIAERFGSQCVVLSIEAKKNGPETWEAYTDNGRERTGFDVKEWAKRGEELGAGEILVTSIDQEGTRKGFDIPLTRALSQTASIPVIASGGLGSDEHCIMVVKEGKADAVAMADMLHYERSTIMAIKLAAANKGLSVRLQ